MGFPGGTVVKISHANAGDTRDPGSVPGSGRFFAVGNGNPLQYACLENSMYRKAWRAPIRGSSPWGCKELDMTEHTEHTHRYTHTDTHTHTHTLS